MVGGSHSDPEPWMFDLNTSYHAALHNVKNAILHRLAEPEGGLPTPDPELTKYFDPPEQVLERSKEDLRRLIKELDVKKGACVV
jgi:ATP-dependent DNA helicase 2 subunit 2